MANDDELMIRIWAEDKEAQEAFKRTKNDAQMTQQVFATLNQGVAGGVAVFQNASRAIASAGGEMGGLAGRAGEAMGRVGNLTSVALSAIPAWNGLTLSAKAAHASMMAMGASNPVGWIMLAAGAVAALTAAFVSLGDNAKEEMVKAGMAVAEMEARLVRLCSPREIKIRLKQEGALATIEHLQKNLDNLSKERAKLQAHRKTLGTDFGADEAKAGPTNHFGKRVNVFASAVLNTDVLDMKIGAIEEKERELRQALEQAKNARDGELEGIERTKDALKQFRESIESAGRARERTIEARHIGETTKVDPAAAITSLSEMIIKAKAYEAGTRRLYERNHARAIDANATPMERQRAEKAMQKNVSEMSEAVAYTNSLDSALYAAQKALESAKERIVKTQKQGDSVASNLERLNGGDPLAKSLLGDWREAKNAASENATAAEENRLAETIKKMEAFIGGSKTLKSLEENLGNTRSAEVEKKRDDDFRRLLASNPARAGEMAAWELNHARRGFADNDRAAEEALDKARQSMAPEDFEKAQEALKARAKSRSELDARLRWQEAADAKDATTSQGTFSARVAAMMAQNGGGMDAAQRQLAAAEKSVEHLETIAKNTKSGTGKGMKP